jgi:hypothetical protein
MYHHNQYPSRIDLQADWRLPSQISRMMGPVGRRDASSSCAALAHASGWMTSSQPSPRATAAFSGWPAVPIMTADHVITEVTYSAGLRSRFLNSDAFNWTKPHFQTVASVRPPECTLASSSAAFIRPSLMRHPDRRTDRIGRRVGAIGQQNARSLDPTRRSRARTRDRLKLSQVVFLNRDIDHTPGCCHRAQPSSAIRINYHIWGYVGIGDNWSVSWNRCTRSHNIGVWKVGLRRIFCI